MELKSVKCQDGYDYDIFDLTKQLQPVLTNLHILNNSSEIFLALIPISNALINEELITIAIHIPTYVLECEENPIYYITYTKNSLEKLFELFLKYTDNEIQHIYFFNKEHTLFEWIDIFCGTGGQAAISKEVNIDSVEKFCKDLNCRYKLYEDNE